MQGSNQKITVFLAETSSDTKSLRSLLGNVLRKAGMDVISANYHDDLETFEEESKAKIAEADCSIHLIGNKFEPLEGTNVSETITHYHLHEAQKRNEQEDSLFKLFIWRPWSIGDHDLDTKQESFVNSVRNSIFNNMVFSNHDAPVLFVEDVRSIMQAEQSRSLNVNSTEIFFIYNELDEDSALQIIDLLEDIAEVEKLNIVQNSNRNYAEFVAQQIKKSRLAVVYFKRTADWAIPFVQQIWKKTGGASSNTNILFLGDGNYDVNKNKLFNAPKIISLVIAEELMPLEIKVQLDKQ